jgi:2-keto-4-pentenoate hydratase/2-oxohepta-3-ene-1,7-dioic acid hydratase in catechol pathway
MLVEYISLVMTLAPGDVVLTGTSAGVGPAAGLPQSRRRVRGGDRGDRLHQEPVAGEG